jgi:hypothetical protein
MEKIQLGDKVPILMQRAFERAVNSVISSTACTMAGEAPAAKSVLAMMSMLTKLVIHWTNGCDSLTLHIAFQASFPHASPPRNSRKLVISLLLLHYAFPLHNAGRVSTLNGCEN